MDDDVCFPFWIIVLLVYDIFRTINDNFTFDGVHAE